MNEITMLKKLMEDFDITELKQLYNELDCLGDTNNPIETISEDLTKAIELFLESPEAEHAIQICFNKEEYDEFVTSGFNKSAVVQLKESFRGL